VRANAVARLEARLSELAGAPVELERPNDPEHGDYATNVAMQLAPVRKRSPRELGEELAAAALGLQEIERAEVAGPGFVNFWLAADWFGEALAEMLEA
jgi:arginyl-tRNA synthetase